MDPSDCVPRIAKFYRVALPQLLRGLGVDADEVAGVAVPDVHDLPRDDLAAWICLLQHDDLLAWASVFNIVLHIRCRLSFEARPPHQLGGPHSQKGLNARAGLVQPEAGALCAHGLLDVLQSQQEPAQIVVLRGQLVQAALAVVTQVSGCCRRLGGLVLVPHREAQDVSGRVVGQHLHVVPDGVEVVHDHRRLKSSVFLLAYNFADHVGVGLISARHEVGISQATRAHDFQLQDGLRHDGRAVLGLFRGAPALSCQQCHQIVPHCLHLCGGALAVHLHHAIHAQDRPGAAWHFRHEIFPEHFLVLA
mmetsp:Transcript_47348/g.135799  ORF Transcript_47348/g.135799 Transcript_47348/m.135799 type:complete len:306 (+) Transcript_47348:330-1247(+)